MFSLFTYFDYFFYFLNPMIYYFTFLIIFFGFYVMSFFGLFFDFFYIYLSSFFFSLGFEKNNIKGHFFLFVSLFFTLFLFNFSSLLPFNFSGTTHISVVFFFSFSLWFMFILFNITKNFFGFLSHLIPNGTPSYLVFFMFIIELISMMIRPLTLMVRLLANILSGHLLIILLSGLVFSLPYFFLFYLFLNVVELFVSLIQSYIFSTLLVLYLTDAL